MTSTDAALAALLDTNRPEQFNVMDRAIRVLSSSPAVTHLMIRGSFASGTSDRLSDVDLVVGIREEVYAPFVEAHDALVAAQLGQLLPGWADTIVPDLGGLGFVHLLIHQDMLYQLDLYLAPAGRIEQIAAATRGRLLYTATDAPAGDADVSQTEVDTYIRERRRTIPTCEQLLVEVLVLAWLIRKRIVRRQAFMAYKEAHQMVTAARSLARTALSPRTAYLGWYHLEDDLGRTPIGRACLADLADLAAAPPLPTQASLARMVDTALTLARRATPETVTDMQQAIDAYQHYLDID